MNPCLSVCPPVFPNKVMVLPTIGFLWFYIQSCSLMEKSDEAWFSKKKCASPIPGQTGPSQALTVFGPFSRICLITFCWFCVLWYMGMMLEYNQMAGKKCAGRYRFFNHFLEFVSLVFADFAYYDRWVWCLATSVTNLPEKKCGPPF